MTRFWVGVSGFSYAGWKGSFYPEDTKPENMLQVYSTKLNSVEINSTFYHMLNDKTTLKWRTSTEDDFRISFKINRRITHVKKLGDVQADTSFFLNALKPLADKLGCVLIQLPPYLKRDTALLEGFLNENFDSMKFAFEFRNDSWLTEEVYAILEKYRATLCVADTPDMKPVFRRTAPFAYVRLRQDRYSKNQLQDWSKKLKTFVEADDECYVYFKHDEAGAAANAAMEFPSLL